MTLPAAVLLVNTSSWVLLTFLCWAGVQSRDDRVPATVWTLIFFGAAAANVIALGQL